MNSGGTTMKRRNPMLRGLPVIMLLCSLLSPTLAPAQFTQQGPKLVATDAIGDPRLGASVSLSTDGNTAIIGGYGDNDFSGAAWVYTRKRRAAKGEEDHSAASDGMWSQQAKLVGTGAIGPFANQGFSVSLSADGNTAIVGGYGDNYLAGAAWVYTRNRRAEKGEEDHSAASDGMWSQQAKLIGTGAIGTAAQGYSVSLSGDGNTAIVGGPSDNNAAGAAWVYTRSRGVWSQQAKLVATGALGPFANQGVSVSLSRDGNTAIIGGDADNGGVPNGVGAAWVYTRSRGVWSQQAKLVGTGAVGPANQGFSVSLSGDGNTAVVGGRLDNGEVGAAWVYTRSGEAWSQQGRKLVGTDAIGRAWQGYSISLSGDGHTAMVGGLSDNSAGAVWAYAEPIFAGTPGKANCYGQSVSALARQFGGLNAAAAALGFSGIRALQNVILAFCGG
jgi:hypothetical protein